MKHNTCKARGLIIIIVNYRCWYPIGGANAHWYCRCLFESIHDNKQFDIVTRILFHIVILSQHAVYIYEFAQSLLE